MKDHAAHAVERVERAIAHIRAGKLVILTDDEDRENEGDLCMAAERVTPAAVNFMAKYGRGLICLSLTEEKVRTCGCRSWWTRARTPPRTAPPSRCRSRRRRVTTGISKDRAHTILTA